MKFKEWFEKQHGKRPRIKKCSDKDLLEIINYGNDAKSELEKREKYDAMLKSALYAWQMKDEDNG